MLIRPCLLVQELHHGVCPYLSALCGLGRVFQLEERVVIVPHDDEVVVSHSLRFISIFCV